VTGMCICDDQSAAQYRDGAVAREADAPCHRWPRPSAPRGHVAREGTDWTQGGPERSRTRLHYGAFPRTSTRGRGPLPTCERLMDGSERIFPMPAGKAATALGNDVLEGNNNVIVVPKRHSWLSRWRPVRHPRVLEVFANRYLAGDPAFTLGRRHRVSLLRCYPNIRRNGHRGAHHRTACVLISPGLSSARYSQKLAVPARSRPSRGPRRPTAVAAWVKGNEQEKNYGQEENNQQEERRTGTKGDGCGREGSGGGTGGSWSSRRSAGWRRHLWRSRCRPGTPRWRLSGFCACRWRRRRAGRSHRRPVVRRGLACVVLRPARDCGDGDDQDDDGRDCLQVRAAVASRRGGRRRHGRS